MRIQIKAEEAQAHRDQVLRFLNSELKSVKNASQRAFVQEMFRVFGECVESAPISNPNPGTRKNQQAPGRLRSSGTLTLDGDVVAEGSEGGFPLVLNPVTMASKAIIGFATPYARIQHEQLNYNHPYGGRAKYIEGPLLNNISRIKATIAGEMRNG